MLPLRCKLPDDAVDPSDSAPLLSLEVPAVVPRWLSLSGRVLLSRRIVLLSIGVRRESLRYKLLLKALATLPERG
jgi:hypothetical protein